MNFTLISPHINCIILHYFKIQKNLYSTVSDICIPHACFYSQITSAKEDLVMKWIGWLILLIPVCFFPSHPCHCLLGLWTEWPCWVGMEVISVISLLFSQHPCNNSHYFLFLSPEPYFLPTQPMKYSHVKTHSYCIWGWVKVYFTKKIIETLQNELLITYIILYFFLWNRNNR